MSEQIRDHGEPAELLCPACGEHVSEASPEGLARCRRCGEQFLAVASETDPAAATEIPRHESIADDSELSELRIRNVSNLRRGAYRSRSYLIIAAGICLVAAVKLIQIAIVAWRGQLCLAATGDALCALAAIMIFSSIVKKIATLTGEIRQSRLKDPASPPDLSQLGDGSQRYRDLEAMAASNPPGGHQAPGANEAQARRPPD